MRSAREFATWVEGSEHFELAAPQILPIINLRLKNAKEADRLVPAHMDIVERVTRDGRRWISETRLAGRSVIRVMIVSYLTGPSHISDLQQALIEAAKQQQKSPSFEGRR